jgi:hypothetical protein
LTVVLPDDDPPEEDDPEECDDPQAASVMAPTATEAASADPRRVRARR